MTHDFKDSLAKMITYQKERLGDFLHEIKPLLEDHYRELAVFQDIPLDPAYEEYVAADDAGKNFVIYTARCDGKLIGYSAFFFRMHNHYKKHSWAINDVIWIHPDYRQSGVGFGFERFWSEQLAALGIHVVQVSTKEQHPELAYLLKKTGYQHTDNMYAKRLN